MADILIVKTDFNGDIRRFAVPQSSYNVKYIKTTVSLLYQLSPEKMALVGVVNNGEIPISNNDDLQNSIQATTTSGNIVRLIVKTVPTLESSQKTEEKAVEISEVPQGKLVVDKVPELTDEMVEKLMEHPKVKAKIQEMVLAALGDKKTLSKLAKKLKKRKSKRSSQNEEAQEVQAEEPSSLASSGNVENTFDLSQSNDQELPEDNEEPEAVEEKKAEDDGQFVVLDNIEPVKKELKFAEALEAKLEALSSSPLIQSLLALFKPKPKSSQNNSPEQSDSENSEKKEEIEIPEETLKQLQEMGFGDREANVKTLKFHKKFNEGLDAVVEDLLQQKTTEVKN